MRGATAPAPVRPNCSARRDAPDRRGSSTAPRPTQRSRSGSRTPGRWRSTCSGGSRTTARTPTSRSARRCSSRRLGELDRKFVTELVYGTTRMRRACDSLVDRFLASPPDAVTRSVLRLGRLSAGVRRSASARRGRRDRRARRRSAPAVWSTPCCARCHGSSVDEQAWPSDGARLSYPDWIVDTFRAELGDDVRRRRWRG